MSTPFHLAFPVNDLEATRKFYVEVDFHIEPYIRFEGEVGEQATMFFPDPSGNFLEFKSFKDPSQLFANDLKQ